MQTNKIDSDLTKIVALKITDIYNANISLCTCEKDWTDGECQKIFANYDRYIISTETCWFLKEQLEAFEKVADAVAPHKGTSFYVSVAIRSGYAHLTIGGPDIGKALDFIRGRIYRINSHIWPEDHPVSEGTGKIVLKVPECFPVLYSLYGCHTSSEG